MTPTPTFDTLWNFAHAACEGESDFSAVLVATDNDTGQYLALRHIAQGQRARLFSALCEAMYTDRELREFVSNAVTSVSQGTMWEDEKPGWLCRQLLKLFNRLVVSMRED